MGMITQLEHDLSEARVLDISAYEFYQWIVNYWPQDHDRAGVSYLEKFLTTTTPAKAMYTIHPIFYVDGRPYIPPTWAGRMRALELGLGMPFTPIGTKQLYIDAFLSILKGLTKDTPDLTGAETQGE